MVRFMVALVPGFALAFGAVKRPLSEQGYAGLTLRDTPIGVVVSWVFPGPLGGEGLTSPTLCRPDLIVAVNGQAMNAEQFKTFIEGTAPGTKVAIEYRRSNARGADLPGAINHRDEIEKVEVTLDPREDWTGTVGRSRGRDTAVTFDDQPMLDPLDEANVLGEVIESNGLAAPLSKLMDVFKQWQTKDEDFHSMKFVRAGFDHPFWLPELQRKLTDPLAGVADDPSRAARHAMWECLDASMDAAIGSEPHLAMGRSEAETILLMSLASAEDSRKSAFSYRDIQGLNALNCLGLLRVPRQSFYLSGPQTRDSLRVIRSSMGLDFGLLLASFDSVRGLIDNRFETLPADGNFETPEAIRKAVEGRICSASFDEVLGWVVIGSTDNNRYDMAKIAAVIDPGGNDEYWASDLRLGTRVIIDLTGDDKYTGTDDQGPGGALMGVSLIDDRAGNDRYEGKMLSAGAAMFGVSLLLDRAGNDTYIGSDWSLGAAMYGAGMIIDLGDGADTYIGEFLCEGVGGPRGFGAIIDSGGNDLYRANGPQASSYDTPAVYQSFSQGIGFGFRHYAAGGIGLINDLGGDDRYEAGEFAQGGAYYYGLGILHDAKGRDLYYGNRYGQGFGVHQAIGALIDDEGDDTYWSMTAASQGSAWDIGVGMLLDRGGNDSYQCDGLGQGGASMQGIAMLIDLAGTDRYAAAIPGAGAGGVQGSSGGNSYHFHETGAFSFSVLMDLGGAADWYSSGRTNSQTIPTGARDDANPENSPLHGLYIDR